jgi:type II secretory pathway component PulC
LSEKITLDFKNMDLEKGIVKLLTNRNYSMFYTKEDNNSYKPTKIIILEQMNTHSTNNSSEPDTTILLGKNIVRSETNETLVKVRKKWFEDQTNNKQKITTDISAVNAVDEPEGRGALITFLSKNSLFEQIGLEKGDIILNIDSVEVNSEKEFINALLNRQNASQTIRIERFNPNKEITYPIYIELNP